MAFVGEGAEWDEWGLWRGSSLEVWRDAGGEGWLTEVGKETERAGMDGMGGIGIAGGGVGSETIEADLRRFDVIELERVWPSAGE